mgnify:FL=1
MAYTYKRLRGRIVEKYGSQEKFARKIGISRVSVSKKLNGVKVFSQNDIEDWALALDIKSPDYPSYFFE